MICGHETVGATGIRWRCTREKHGPGPDIIERDVYGHHVVFTLPSAHWYRAVKDQS